MDKTDLKIVFYDSTTLPLNGVSSMSFDSRMPHMETFETEAGTYIINTNMIKYVYKRNDDNAA